MEESEIRTVFRKHGISVHEPSGILICIRCKIKLKSEDPTAVKTHFMSLSHKVSIDEARYIEGAVRSTTKIIPMEHPLRDKYRMGTEKGEIVPLIPELDIFSCRRCPIVEGYGKISEKY